MGRVFTTAGSVARRKKSKLDHYRIFSIIDRDGTGRAQDDEESGRFTWDVYHIENYLLDESVILDVLKKSTISEAGFAKNSEVERELRGIAKEQIDELVEHAVREKAHQIINGAIRLKGERRTGEGAGRGVSRRVSEAIERLAAVSKKELSAEELDDVAKARRATLESAIEENEWKKEFRGREILKVFASRYGRMRYETMRDMIVNTMADRNQRPPGMLRILERIDKRPYEDR